MDCTPIGPVEPKRLDQVLPLRLDPEVAAGLRDVANQRGVTVPDLLREAAERIVRWGAAGTAPATFEARVEYGYVYTVPAPASATWRCEHLTMTGPFPFSPSGFCGCELQPA